MLFLRQDQGRLVSQLGYHAMRLLSYIAVSILIRMSGRELLSSIGWSYISQIYFITLVLLAAYFIFKVFRWKQIEAALIRSAARLLKLAPAPSHPLILGGLSGILPCGLLVPAYLGAIASPDLRHHVTGIGLFFAGTLPAMLIGYATFSALFSKLPTGLQRYRNALAGSLFLGAQAYMILVMRSH